MIKHTFHLFGGMTAIELYKFGIDWKRHDTKTSTPGASIKIIGYVHNQSFDIEIGHESCMRVQKKDHNMSVRIFNIVRNLSIKEVYATPRVRNFSLPWSVQQMLRLLLCTRHSFHVPAAAKRKHRGLQLRLFHLICSRCCCWANVLGVKEMYVTFWFFLFVFPLFFHFKLANRTFLGRANLAKQHGLSAWLRKWSSESSPSTIWETLYWPLHDACLLHAPVFTQLRSLWDLFRKHGTKKSLAIFLM